MSELVNIVETFDAAAVVSEMATGSDVLVSLDPEVVARVTEGDDEPKFVTYVIESGWSKSKRLWQPAIFDKVHEQISKAASEGDPIVGYLGHIKPEDDPYAFPPIQFQWLRSSLKKVGDKAQLAVKAYVLPDSKARDYIKRGLGKTVSWYGPVAQVPFQKGVRIEDFHLESIDLARPRRAGMSARLVAVTSEMSTEEGDEMKPDEIAELQENELRAHNPKLVQSIEQTATKPLETKIGEMTAEADAAKPTLEFIPQLRALLGLAESTDDVTVITKAVEQIKAAGKSLRDSVLASVLDKKLKGDDSGLVRRLIVGEMSSRWDDVELTGDTDKDEKTVGEMVNHVIDGDDEMKKVVSEMEGVPATPAGTSTDRGDGSRKIEAGYANSNISVRSANRR